MEIQNRLKKTNKVGISITLPIEWFDKIEKYGEGKSMNESIRYLVELGLLVAETEAKEKEKQ